MQKIGWILTLVATLFLAIPAMIIAAPLEVSLVPEVEVVFDIVPVAVESDGMSTIVNYNFINYQGLGAFATLLLGYPVALTLAGTAALIALYLWDNTVVPSTALVGRNLPLLANGKPGAYQAS